MEEIARGEKWAPVQGEPVPTIHLAMNELLAEFVAVFPSDRLTSTPSDREVSHTILLEGES